MIISVDGSQYLFFFLEDFKKSPLIFEKLKAENIS